MTIAYRKKVNREQEPSSRFEVDKVAVRQLADVLNETNLTEIEYEYNNKRIKVCRNVVRGHVVSGVDMATVVPSSSPISTVQGMKTESSQVLKENVPTNNGSYADHPGAVSSPMVGTVYLAPSPDANPFAREGEIVIKGQTLLIIEAMKVMNPIRAPKAGTVKKVLVKNAAPVEYGQVLIVIE